MAASMPQHGPASGEDTAPEGESVALLKACLLFVRVATLIGRAVIQKNARIALHATMHTDMPDWSLPAYRRGTLRGMDAA
ncbi:hypothetical protein [Xanthomonas campestris]|uniref:hypothetical protein n=1 Tax=Xanthomonas campestris TaxID=339 RepID=UPI0021613B4F|nr:hypothetical protein [Xanthomonas campestris]MEA9843378.1 hypothetical protein [Xanthomonas campestris pv. raphani]MEA9904973.1 hypothetical protein [Xanthomonas campestris pv. raphani]MEA9920940.1 hypothetical protein [Xanthomonas campestris pv. raphani]